MMPPLAFTLPYPPSVNHYWRHVGNRVLVSRQGRDYRRNTEDRALTLPPDMRRWLPMTGPVRVTLVLCAPDRRKRDLDNVIKAVLDGLQYGGVLADDAQVRALHAVWGDVSPDGYVDVLIDILESPATGGAPWTVTSRRGRQG